MESMEIEEMQIVPYYKSCSKTKSNSSVNSVGLPSAHDYESYLLKNETRVFPSLKLVELPKEVFLEVHRSSRLFQNETYKNSTEDNSNLCLKRKLKCQDQPCKKPKVNNYMEIEITYNQ